MRYEKLRLAASTGLSWVLTYDDQYAPPRLIPLSLAYSLLITQCFLVMLLTMPTVRGKYLYNVLEECMKWITAKP